MEMAMVIMLLGLLSMTSVSCRPSYGLTASEYPAMNCRKHSASLTDYGGVGDGKTSNTKAFKAAIEDLSKFASDGGAQLIIPPGKWLTGSFNLTSHFTLYLEKDAVILASQDESEYPLIPALPSYGRGRDASGDGLRYSSFIFGTNLTDVILTGANGTIDGQGSTWWKNYKKDKLKYTRPTLIEIMYSSQIQISSLTLLNSPQWNVHPIYSSDIIIQGLTILAPIDPISPNTDGINPDSCSNVRIEDNYIVSGDDCIAIKSGWDEYGIKVGMPSQHIIIRRLTCISPDSALIALGSEMSGGIQDIRIEDIVAINTESGIRIKTAPGRGGYIKDIYARNVTMQTMKYVFWMIGSYGSHADEGFDPKALPEIKNINYNDMTATNVTMSGNLAGIKDDPFTNICISNVNIEMSSKPKKLQWNCTDIEGTSSNVSPQPCESLADKGAGNSFSCPFPTDKLPIEDVQLKTCTY
ncbi:hypothetical protein AQUCO_03800085v1 [Aquilegia coerulea]|uniref:Pectate lyase superfamily protein domain-containing protein n=1 Tax=Aquilegia coerulea TaxID=218851 RepID=A0A2G5CSI9_AQUCA|nr:hypothetical protein AQUCO_03800085v1 [Aquilegia coerulea]